MPDIIATRIYDPEPELVLSMDGDVSISYDKDVDGHGVSPNVKKFIVSSWNWSINVFHEIFVSSF